MYVLGTGSFGAIVKYFLEKERLEVEGFIDLNKDTKNKSFAGTKIVDSKEVDCINKVILASNRNNHEWIKKEYSKFTNIVLPEDILDLDMIEQEANENIEGVTWSNKKIIDEIRNYKIQQSTAKIDIQKEKPTLKSLDIVVTERCSLRCIDCSNLMQYYQKPKNFDFEVAFDSLKKITKSANINCLRLIGGEPLLVKELDLLLNKIEEELNEDIKNIEVYTNGTIVPKESLFEECKKHRITFYISNYGEYSRNIRQLIEKLELHGIEYTVENELIWQDSGRIKDYDDENIDYKYSNCCVNKTFSLINDKLYSCPFSANYHNLYKEEKISSRDVIEIDKDLGTEILTKKIYEMIMDSTPLSACYYCNGRDYSVKEVPVAVQSKEILRR